MYFPLYLARCLAALLLVIITVFTGCPDHPKHNSFSFSRAHSKHGVQAAHKETMRPLSPKGLHRPEVLPHSHRLSPVHVASVYHQKHIVIK